MNERALGSLLDLQPEEELQLTHHAHLELSRHLSSFIVSEHNVLL